MHGARPFPLAAAKILTLTAREDFDVAAVVKTLESDAPMAVRVLRVVNSAVFGLRSKVTSIKHAVAMLGSKGVRDATIAGSVLNLFPGDGTKTWQKLHNHAVVCGALARHLAADWRLPEDEMFAAAFLHDIGKWILLEQEKDYAKILEAHGDSFEGTLDEEHGVFGFDHAELAEHMLTNWSIPQPIPRIVGLHHDPSTAFADSPGLAQRVSLLRLCDRLAYAYVNGETPDFDELAATDFCTYLGLNAEHLEDRFDSLRLVHQNEDDARPRHSSAPRLKAAKKGSKARGRKANKDSPIPSLGLARVSRPDPIRESVPNPPVSTTQLKDEPMPASIPLPEPILEEPPIVPEITCTTCGSGNVRVQCKRCACHYCEEHGPAKKKLCEDCEAKYAARLEVSRVPSAGLVWFFVFAAACTAGSWFVLHVHKVGLFASAFGLCFLASLLAFRRLGFRQRFLRGE
ncbi:MAG TPA: HDOD domain-containing protein [Polyangiaceae bacterium]